MTYQNSSIPNTILDGFHCHFPGPYALRSGEKGVEIYCTTTNAPLAISNAYSLEQVTEPAMIDHDLFGRVHAQAEVDFVNRSELVAKTIVEVLNQQTGWPRY